MSVKSEPIIAIDMQPAPTRPAVSSAVVLRGGLAVVSNVQVRLMAWNAQVNGKNTRTI